MYEYIIVITLLFQEKLMEKEGNSWNPKKDDGR